MNGRKNEWILKWKMQDQEEGQRKLGLRLW